MRKYENLTKYLLQLNDEPVGEWIIDHKNDGSLEHPKQMPFVNYTEMVHHFIEDVYAFKDTNEDLELNRYGEILQENGLEWGGESMRGADVSTKNARCVLALIMGAVRAERFCDGALLSFFKDGSIRKWLQRLEDIDSLEES